MLNRCSSNIVDWLAILRRTGGQVFSPISIMLLIVANVFQAKSVWIVCNDQQQPWPCLISDAAKFKDFRRGFLSDRRMSFKAYFSNALLVSTVHWRSFSSCEWDKVAPSLPFSRSVRFLVLGARRRTSGRSSLLSLTVHYVYVELYHSSDISIIL